MRDVDVVTVFCPRPEHPKWMDYLPLLRAQKASAEKFGHQHWVVTDGDVGDEFLQLKADLPADLMPAMIAGIIHRIIRGGNRNVLFVDADCLIGRDLRDAFSDEFDIRLTRRPNDKSPVNNGAMYVTREGFDRARAFFDSALSHCGVHWGADQEAISKVSKPVPETAAFAVRQGCKIQFSDMKPYNVVPKVMGRKHRCDPYVIHFKGSTKEWMLEYAERYLT